MYIFIYLYVYRDIFIYVFDNIKYIHIEEKKEKRYVEDSSKEDSVDEDEQKLIIKEEPEISPTDHEQNISAASSCDYSLSQFKDQLKEEDEEEPEMDTEGEGELTMDVKKEEMESDEDMPLVRSSLKKFNL